MSNLTITLEEQDERTSTVKIYVNGLAPIRAGGRVKYQRLRLNAGVIPTRDWDHRMGRPSAAFSRRDGGTLHRTIDLTCLNVQRAYMECPVKTAKAVRARYDELLGRKHQVAHTSTFLLDIVEGWIRKGEMSNHTQHTYSGFARKVEDHERRSRAKLDLSVVTTQELEAFLQWIRKSYKLASNTMATQQKFVNKALNEVRGSGVPVCKNVKVYGFTTPKKDILDWEDLAKICTYVPKSRTEANAQTLLVAICLSSVRISDIWLHLRSIEKRSGVLCSDFIVTKNASKHPVNVSPIVFEPVRLLLERNGTPPHVSEIHVRRSIKALLAAVGITKHVQVHSLRRSFVSLSLSLGLIPDHLLARVFTGHRMVGEKSIFHSYNHASMGVAQKTVIALLRMIDPKQTGGLQLLSEEVCST